LHDAFVDVGVNNASSQEAKEAAEKKGRKILSKYLFAPNIQTSGAKAHIFKGLNGTTEEAAEKRLFCAFRFATRRPSAEWNCSFSTA